MCNFDTKLKVMVEGKSDICVKSFHLKYRSNSVLHRHFNLQRELLLPDPPLYVILRGFYHHNVRSNTTSENYGILGGGAIWMSLVSFVVAQIVFSTIKILDEIEFLIRGFAYGVFTFEGFTNMVLVVFIMYCMITGYQERCNYVRQINGNNNDNS